jgi:2-keto-4-pentenoate hydratase/2-oxohepta-3-ene-1,7-dioic acid hydratase in catechol pathway
MRFVRFDDWKTGLITNGPSPQVVDIAASVQAFRSIDRMSADLLAAVLADEGRCSWGPMIERWGQAKAALGNLLEAAAKDATHVSMKPLEAARLGPPLPSRSPRIFAIGGNVAKQWAREKIDGLPPWGFSVYPETVVGPHAPVAPPPGVQKFDYEGEVVVILASQGRNVKASQVELWGYSAWNDLSIRDARFGIGPPVGRGDFSWNLEKNFETGNAMGPWVAVDEGRGVAHLRVLTRVNGQTRQDWNTSEMAYSFADVTAHLSHYLPVQPTDMITSGTGEGTAMERGRDGDRWLKPGDAIDIEVEGLGAVLSNSVGKW